MEHSSELEAVDVTSASTTRSVTTSKEKIDRIRDIIFGAQIREYTQRFDTLSRELSRVGQEVTRLTTQMQEQERRLRNEIRQESDRMLAQLQDQETAHQQQVHALEQRLTEQLQTLDQNHMMNAQQLATNLGHVEQLLRDELHTLSQQLHNAKVDRPALGDLLIQLGNNLRNTEPEPLQIATNYLEQLGDELLLDELLQDASAASDRLDESQ